jgi:ubiquinone/menaquinone biosynthesis C-methylase UbiE
MSVSADLYNTSYANFESPVIARIRAETYGEDLGQTGWMTATELRRFARLLKITSESRVLEVGCGSGGSALFLARTIGCSLTGIDINDSGIRNARRLASQNGLGKGTEFRKVDGSHTLPFANNSFDAVFSNDVMCHIPDRRKVLREWLRVLRPAGSMLFTDAMVITGLISNLEIATRSMIGKYFFLPAGENERLIRSAGFRTLKCEDLTSACTNTAMRWHDSRAKYSAQLSRLEGAQNYRALQEFLWCVRTLTKERRLSRFSYLAVKPKQ